MNVNRSRMERSRMSCVCACGIGVQCSIGVFTVCRSTSMQKKAALSRAAWTYLSAPLSIRKRRSSGRGGIDNGENHAVEFHSAIALSTIHCMRFSKDVWVLTFEFHTSKSALLTIPLIFSLPIHHTRSSPSVVFLSSQSILLLQGCFSRAFALVVVVLVANVPMGSCSARM